MPRLPVKRVESRNESEMSLRSLQLGRRSNALDHGEQTYGSSQPKPTLPLTRLRGVMNIITGAASHTIGSRVADGRSCPLSRTGAAGPKLGVQCLHHRDNRGADADGLRI